MKTIKIVDAICGAGKSSYAIQEMNKPFGGKFIYVTPYLSEIKRAVDATNGDLKEPSNKNEKGSKIESFRNLVTRGENIACTHELFKLCDDNILELIRNEKYTLILDEVLNVINPIVITKSDLKALIKTKTIEIKKETGIIKWIKDDYEGRFEDLKQLSKNDNLFLFNDTFIFWTLHKKAFEVFDEIFILTYLFDGQIQRYYYDLHDFKYERFSVIFDNEYNEYKLVPHDNRLDHREKIAERLEIYEDKGKSKFNSNYCKRPSYNMFSSNWLKNCDSKTLERIKSNLSSYFRSVGGGAKSSYWTTTKKTAKSLKTSKNTYYETDKKSNFVSVNIRATNEYMNCTSCAFIYNRYMNPIEKAFFEFHGVRVDEDVLALSDLIQFLFRGVIRVKDSNEKMSVYIPSIRMRELLYKYLSYEI